MTPKIITYRGDELFRTDADGKPVVSEHVTKEQLAEALLDCIDYERAQQSGRNEILDDLTFMEGSLEKQIDDMKRGLSETLFPGQTLELVPFGIKVGNIGITAG